jgi:tetratricopeptide (TPR) repeat protein
MIRPLLVAASLLVTFPAQANDWDDCNSRTVERSIKGCTRIINSRPARRADLAGAYAARAVAHLDNDDADAARADADKAIEVDERSGLGWAVRGHLQNRAKAYKEAIRSFDKAAGFTPKDSGVWEGRSVARLQLGDRDGALSDANRALQVDPKSTVGYLLRARIRLDRNQIAQAFPDIERALAIDPKRAEAYYWRAQANRKAGELAKALKDADKALELDAKDWEGFLLRGLIKAENGRPRDGLADVDRALQLKPDDGDAHGARALLLMGIEDYDTALKHANRAIELKDEQGLEIRGLIFLRLGEVDQAITDLSAALAQNASDSGINARVGRAEAYAAQRRFGEAVTDMEAAARATPWLPRERQSHARAKERLPELKREAGLVVPAPPARALPKAEPDLTIQPKVSQRAPASFKRELSPAPGAKEASGAARGWTMLGSAGGGFCVLRQYLPRGHIEYWRWSDDLVTWLWVDDRLRGDGSRPVRVDVGFDERPLKSWSWLVKAQGSVAVTIPESWLLTSLPRFDRIALRSGGASATYSYAGFSQGYAQLARCIP